MVRPSAGGSSAGKKKASAAKKTRIPAGSKKSKGAKTKKRQKASDQQINTQLKAVKHIKDRLKEVVGRFEEAYPDGLDFTPNASDADFA